MRKDFREPIRTSLANETLQLVLDANAECRVSDGSKRMLSMRM